MDDLVVSVSEFVALINQTLEYAYPNIVIEGEVSEYRVSKGKWVYFKLQDDNSSVQCFSSVYQMNYPVEDGMLVKLKGSPRLHNKYGFSVNVQTVTPSGEGGIKKALEALKKKLDGEGLFDESRKRPLPEFPNRIGLVTSGQAAAYSDFLKIIDERWSNSEIIHADVQVQGEPAPGQIARAIEYLNTQSEPVDVIVITRGGGSAEDLIAFSAEEVVRAIAASRAPTVVGVGHEVDISLADLAADVRATTPTNAAQIVVPSREELAFRIARSVDALIAGSARPVERINEIARQLVEHIDKKLDNAGNNIEQFSRTIKAYDPKRMLSRGYGLVRDDSGVVVSNSKQVKVGQNIMIELSKGKIESEVKNVEE